MMRLLLDTNIVLDVLLARTPWVESARQIWQAHDEGRITAFLPASALTDIFYIVRRVSDRERARAAVTLCIATFELCPVARSTLEVALDLVGDDFEDNVALACAIESRLDGLVTRDPQGFLESPIAVLAPAQLLQRLDALE